jgi:antirestriction protein ArdC
MPRSPSQATPADSIARAIIERLEAGTRPWARPWGAAAPERPLRAGGEPYRGINLFWLWLVAEAHGYASRYWMTYRQASELGGQVRRGERAAPAVFYKPGQGSRRADDDADDRPRVVLKSYSVFNADQIAGLPARFHARAIAPAPWVERLPVVAAFFERLPGEVRLGGNIAAYDRRLDLIRLPSPERFGSAEAFYATLAHERAHWTGHPSRLARDFGQRFGDPAYALEELTAELASAIIGAELGLAVDHLDDHAAYIGSWLAALSAQPRLVLSVAAKAQAAADFLLAYRGQESCSTS